MDMVVEGEKYTYEKEKRMVKEIKKTYFFNGMNYYLVVKLLFKVLFSLE